MILAALEFPPVSHLVEWPALFLEDTPFAINKVVVLTWLAVVLTFGMFWVAARKARKNLVPRGTQNVVESIIDFVKEGVILQTIGPEGMVWMPFLTTLMVFIFWCNVFEVIPILQMPVNGRIALPAFLAILAWVLFNFIGIKYQGFRGYFRSMLFPPGVPKALYVLVTPIELVSTIIVRPLSLAIRLFANMLAGHLLLVSFSILTAALLNTIIGWTLPFALLVGVTGFEVLVSVLQAFIFTILTAVYIGGAMHPEH